MLCYNTMQQTQLITGPASLAFLQLMTTVISIITLSLWEHHHPHR
jgi:hypothetical protein